ncbi:MAG: TrkA family potassium uptake protein [Acidimicrobiales bacterium]|nr:TrkA family potassium uptake protein [Acidimicrobiales bacterium]MBO0886958.1 TrkA family potassium uptake protein [Acidimicrobiales bacterium]
MHVVVVGCGRVGSELAVALTDRGESVAIIDKSPTAFRRLPPQWTGRIVVGYGFDRDHLEEAGIREAGALAAVTSGDNSNILTARIARETYQVPSVVARIYDPRRAVIYQRVGIPTVATVTWTTDQVLRRLFPEVSTAEWIDASGQLVLLERTLPAVWAARRLGQLQDGGRVTLVAVTRGGVPRLDVADMVGQEGDLLHVMVRKEAVDELEERLEKGPSQ